MNQLTQIGLLKGEDVEFGLFVPVILIRLKSLLKSVGGLKLEYIFRKTGTDNFEHQIHNSLISDLDTKIQENDAHSIASVLKKWFKLKPDFLLEKYRISDLKEISKQGPNLYQFISKISPENRSIFLWIICLCKEVVARENLNKMSAKSMAHAFVPILMDIPMNDPKEGLENTNTVSEIIEKLITM